MFWMVCRRSRRRESGSAHKAAAAEVYFSRTPGPESSVCDRWALELCWNRSISSKYRSLNNPQLLDCKYGTWHIFGPPRDAHRSPWSTAAVGEAAGTGQATTATSLCSSRAPCMSATIALSQRPFIIWCQICYHRVPLSSVCECQSQGSRAALTWEVCSSRVAGWSAPRGGHGLVQALCGQRSAFSLRIRDLRPLKPPGQAKCGHCRVRGLPRAA